MIEVNDGKRQCGSVGENAFSQAAPFRFDQKTDILITTANYDIINLRKGFLNAHLTFQVSIQKIEPSSAWGTWTDPDHLGKLFIGYKASCQACRELQLYANNVATN
jgi:hypothetical protein